MATWFDRLTVARRFVLVGALALLLVAGPTALFVRQSVNRLAELDRQARGIGPSQALLQLVQLTQQHRGLSALVLAGNPDAPARRQAKAREVDQAAERLRQALATQPVGSVTLQAWRQAHTDWETLRERSASAAKEIKQLIDTSVKGVEVGARQVREAGSAMNDIVDQVRRVALMIQEMSGASAEQAEGIGQIGHAVGQLDQMTQQNAALVEQSAAAADSLSRQARLLAEVVRRFRLDADTPAAASTTGTPANPSAAPVMAAAADSPAGWSRH